MNKEYKTFITAHSGCEGTERDSLETIERALRYGADIIEMDVRMAPTGVLRISHNRMTAEEYEAKPTLEEVFRRIKDTHLRINCDLKEQSTLYAVLLLGERMGLGADRLILSGCTSPEQLARDPEIVKRAAVYLNMEEILKYLYLAEGAEGCDTRFRDLMSRPWSMMGPAPTPERWLSHIVRCCKMLGVQGLNLPKDRLPEELIVLCHEAELPFSVWTVNEPEIMDKCLRVGAENITTLEVKLAVEKREAFLRETAEK